MVVITPPSGDEESLQFLLDKPTSVMNVRVCEMRKRVQFCKVQSGRGNHYSLIVEERNIKVHFETNLLKIKCNIVLDICELL